MFLTIFKTIISVLLVGVLFIVVSYQDVKVRQKTKFFQNIKKLTLVSDLSESKNSQNLDVPQVLASTTTPESLPLPSLISTTPSETPNITKVKEIPKDSQYIKIELGSSDNDESYRPLLSPCKVVMKYKIGRFDTHFGISQSKFIDEINIAGDIWGDQLGRKLFMYDENGSLIINLIYDERQTRTESLNNLTLEINNSKDTAESLKNLYEQEKKIYVGDSDQLTKDNEMLIARYQLYTDKVAMYNSKGGAPQTEYEEMNQELAYLKATSKELAARRDALLLYMEKINAKVTHYNELVAYTNSLINQSNTLGTKKFTEGRFNPTTNTIDIYQYADPIKLRRVITHELGHVIGINHTSNMSSIMYSVNSGTTTTLSAEDIYAFRNVCPK